MTKQNPDIAGPSPEKLDYEHLKREAPLKSVIISLVGIAIFVIGVAWLMWEYKGLYEDPSRPRLAGQVEGLPSPDMTGGVSGTVAGPRLQVDEAKDFRVFREEQENFLSTGLSDSAGIAMRVPIDEAMKAVVAKGLPVRVQ